MDKPRSFAPIIAAVLLLLPVLYVGSYFALVTPGAWSDETLVRYVGGQRFEALLHGHRCYRYYNRNCSVVFWPLEQIDRRVRPAAWEGQVIRKQQIDGPFIPEREVN